MKEQFVTYEIALKLKELGFDEECFGYWNKGELMSFKQEPNSSFYAINIKHSVRISAPLWQQVIDWLDENYVFLVVVKYDKIYGYQWDIRGKKNKPIYRCAVTYQRLYDARERAILTAIELCKQ